MNNFLLLPGYLKVAGVLLILPGLILATIRFYFEKNLEIFNTKVFAIYSSYFETKYFTIIDNHISEEIAGCLILGGLFLVAFSREKIEDERINLLRLKSLILALYINTGFLILSLIFIYGFGFFKVMIINLFTPLVLYIAIFRIKIIFHRNGRLHY